MARIPPGLLLLLATIAVCAVAQSRPGQTSPTATVLAFAKALKDHDYKAMAALVVGGQAKFDYNLLQGDGQEFDEVYAAFDVKILGVEVEGDHARVRMTYTYSTQDGSSGGLSQDGETVQLAVDQGTWKIVPNTTSSWESDFERLAGILAEPEKVLAQQESYLAPTRNHTQETIKLGKDRAKFFDRIITLPQPRREEDPPYPGYKSMTDTEHTTVLWPVGRADEVLFCYTNQDFWYLTRWVLAGSKLKRMWHIELPRGKGKAHRNGRGTLVNWIGSYGKALPKNMPADMKKTLAMVRPYAAYQEAGAIARTTCWVIDQNGAETPKDPDAYPQAIWQDSFQASKRGYFITPHEVKLLEHRQRQASDGRSRLGTNAVLRPVQ